jgi:hypothetical protein
MDCHAAYECLHGIITPWTKGQISDAMMGTWRDSFNCFHSSNRIHIEQAFGILVGRWGILWRPLRMYVTRVAPILSTCLRLHNYCIDEGVRPVRAWQGVEQQEAFDAAYKTWWEVASHLRVVTETDTSQGRRADLDTSDLREKMTCRLMEQGLTRLAPQ